MLHNQNSIFIVNATVSIALATYNGERFLREQLDSIYSQSYPPSEVVVTDDRSTDATIAILEEYKRKKGLQYFINETRLGFLKNFEKAISLCSGDYIALSDQDDVWHPDKIRISLEEIRDFPLVCSDVSIIDEKGALVAQSYRRRLHIPIPEQDNQFCSLAFINFVTGSTCLFPRAMRTRFLPIPEEAMSHDWWMGIQATQFGGVKYIKRALVRHRRHGVNAIGVKELWSLSGRLRYVLSKERKTIFEKEKARIQYYLKHGIYSGDAQEEFLKDLLLHYTDILESVLHTKAFRIVWKHRRSLFREIGPAAKWTYMLGRLF